MMELTENQKKGQEFIEKLIKNCWEDNAFKKELIASPLTTIEKVAGKKSRFPKGTQVVVEDQTDPSIVYFNIPAKPNYDNMELTDEQLEIVAGGEIVVVVGLTVAFGAGLAVGYYLV